MEKEIEKILEDLGKNRPVFWSEADFQFTFAWELKQKFPEADIILEKREEIVSRKNKDKKIPAYIDIWMEKDKKIYPIELKYKTQSLKTTVNGEEFELKPQSARDVGGHNYIKDIWRMEQLSKREDFGKGYAIMITNDLAYTKEPHKPDTTTFRKFRIFEGRELKAGEELKWYSASDGTTESSKEWQKKEGSLTIMHGYQIEWKDYSNVRKDPKDNGIFKYSIIEIKK